MRVWMSSLHDGLPERGSGSLNFDKSDYWKDQF